jgi:hypothetical protein
MMNSRLRQTNSLHAQDFANLTKVKIEQHAEITRLLAENQRLKAINANMFKALGVTHKSTKSREQMFNARPIMSPGKSLRAR